MAKTNEPDVKDVERVEVAPAGGDNADEPETETQPDSSQEETNEEGETEEVKPEPEESEEEAEAESDDSEPEPQNAAPKDERYGEVKPLDGETKREFALRLENARLRDEVRKKQGNEILTPPPTTETKNELPLAKKEILKKYKTEDINTLKEVFDVMADEMGFVRKDQLGASTYQEKATEVLDEFLEKHPEYQPQNDAGNVLWNRFKEEFGMYKHPANPRDLKKVLEKVHKEVFGIKPVAALNKNDAAKEKIKVASHNGAPRPSREGVKRTTAPVTGLRTDMLKGFSDEEIADLVGSE